LQLLQIASFYQQIATGVILLIGVGLSRVRSWAPELFSFGHDYEDGADAGSLIAGVLPHKC